MRKLCYLLLSENTKTSLPFLVLQIFFLQFTGWYTQKQPSRGVLKKRCSENIQQIKLLCNFIKIALHHECFPAYFQNTFSRTPLDGCFCIRKYEITSEFSQKNVIWLFVKPIRNAFPQSLGQGGNSIVHCHRANGTPEQISSSV